MFALRPETSLRIYTYAPDRHSLPVRQTLPPVRKTETEEKTVRRLLLQIPARLRKVLTIINCGEATLLPPRFCFSIRHRKDVLFSVIASAAWRSRRLAYERLCNLLRRLATGLPRSLRSLAKTSFLFRHSERSVAIPRSGVRECLYNLLRRLERDCRGRFAPSQRRPFLFRHRERSVAIPKIGVRTIIILLHTNRSIPGLRTR